MDRWQRAACIVWSTIVLAGIGRAALLPFSAPFRLLRRLRRWRPALACRRAGV